MRKLFYGVYIEDRLMSGIIDLVRYISEPDSFRFSHLTIRGPYTRKIGEEELNRLNLKVRHWIVSVERVGNFFLGKQNTVYLAMDIGPLRELWHKPDFPNGKSHITLYDGNDRDYAKALFNLADQYNWTRMLSTSKLKLLDAKVSLSSDFLHPFMGLYEAYENLAPRGGPPLSAMGQVDKRERLNIVGDILVNLRLPPSQAPIFG